MSTINNTFDFICSFINEHGYSPSYREIGKEFKISTSTVFKNIQMLKERGLIDYEPKKNRTIRIAGGNGK